MNKIVSAAPVVCLLFTSPVLAEGDIAGGKKTFKRCSACHSIEEGQHTNGPSMHGIFGAKAGQADGYKYSNALLEADLIWDEATLRAFLAKPKKLVPKTKMGFPGLKKEKDLDNIIAYLKSLQAN